VNLAGRFLWHNAVSPAPQGGEHEKELLFFCCVPAWRQKEEKVCTFKLNMSAAAALMSIKIR
jgi:hypothetical protein